MADARIIVFDIPTVTATTKWALQFSRDRVNWTDFKIGSSTTLNVSALTARKYTLDGVNGTDTSATNPVACSTPPMWYRYRLGTSTGPTWGNWAAAFVVPSPQDFLAFAKHRLKDPSLTDERPLLEDWDYLDCLSTAIQAFEQTHPQRASQSFSMTNSTQSYALPDLWSNDFSKVTEVEYPVQSADPRTFIETDWVLIDEDRDTWRFRRVFPATSESARLYFTLRHARDGSTVPPAYFESVGLWMAGEAARQLGAEKIQFGDLQISADYVQTDPRIKRWMELEKSYKAEAEKLWGTGQSGIRVNIPLYEDHALIPSSVWSQPGQWR